MARLLIQAWEMAGEAVELASRLRSHEAKGDPVRQAEKAREAEQEAERLIAAFRARPAADRPDAWFTYHLYYKAPDWIGPKVTAALGIPYLVAEASLAPKRVGGPWSLGHGAALAAIRSARRLFVINPVDRECLDAVVEEPERFVPLPPFLDTGSYAQAASDRPTLRGLLAERHGIDERQPWIITVAMMRPGDKLASYRVLARSLLSLRERNWQLLVAGGGDVEDEVRRELRGLGDRRVHYLGVLDVGALPAFYAASDIFFWPAISEAYGMALLEAQSSGLPAVAGASGGVPAIVEDGKTGLLVPAEDSAALASAVARLLDQPETRAAMRKAALAKTGRQHDIATAARILGGALASVRAEDASPATPPRRGSGKG
jgi:glycosyltransferase involved in cell wall biosynthesis